MKPASLLAAIPGWTWAVLLPAVFLLTGIFGHDPWKPEDAAHFGVVWRAHGNGEWLQLGFATGNLIEPPLYYWVAGALGQLLAPLFGWPDAVRLASPLFLGIACLLLAVTSRELHGRDSLPAAPLLLVGSLGFLVQSHETQPLLAALAGIAATYAGCALAGRRPWSAAALLGAGLGGTVLAHGVTLLPALLLTVFAAATMAPERRQRLLVTVGACVLAAILIVPWLWAVDAAAPGAVARWWAGEMQQFDAIDAPGSNAAVFGKLLLWFAWPALPLALWGLWVERQRLAESGRMLPLLAVLAMASGLVLVFPARGQFALPLLPGLVLLAVPGLLALRRGAANAFDWFGRMTFTLAAGLIWLGWVAMHFGVPAKISRNFAKLAPGFVPEIDFLAVAAAIGASLAWLWLIALRPRTTSPLRPLQHWSSGLTMLWVLTICLWLPWIDYGRSYRSVAAAIDARIASPSACVAVRGVGEAQLASFDYFLSRRLRGDAGAKSCRWLLVQGTAVEKAPGGGWVRVWEGARPGDKYERFRLYRRG